MPESGLLTGLLQEGLDATRLVAFRHGKPLYFKDLIDRASAWRTALLAAPGQRFALHSSDGFEFVAMLFGAWHAGKCALVPSDLQAGAIKHLDAAVDGYAGMPDGLQAGAPSTRAWEMLDPGAPLLEMFTSGSTGTPARIPKSLRQLERELAGLATTLDFGPRAAPVCGTVSHQHMYGLVFRLLLPLVTGRPFEAQRLLQVGDLGRLQLPEGCVMVTSPAQLARLPPGTDVSCRIHVVLSAGGPLGEEAAQRCRETLGAIPTEIYGSTETGAVAWRRRVAGALPCWQGLPDVEFREQDGLLQIRGPQLPGIEWFCSADRVVMTDHGFQLAGRSDRIVKLDEKRISLEALERVLLASGLLRQVHALVLDGHRPALAVVAMPNADGWKLAAEGKPRLVAVLTDGLRRNGGVEVLPRSWRFVDPWPATVDGKSPESLLRARFDRRIPEFRVLQQEAARCVAELWVSPTAPFFNGHFPNQPILPGVAQIEWLVWLARELMGVDAGFAGLDAAKFRRVILPGGRLRVTLVNDVTRHSTSYQIDCAEQLCASGRIRWSAA